ncbi:hypothetical protein FQN57_006612 [Myotisia sp. PD_48]|nr:hypothetical protein FQN57_006612 [Myotisia sp. PD_48]
MKLVRRHLDGQFLTPTENGTAESPASQSTQKGLTETAPTPTPPSSPPPEISTPVAKFSGWTVLPVTSLLIETTPANLPVNLDGTTDSNLSPKKTKKGPKGPKAKPLPRVSHTTPPSREEIGYMTGQQWSSHQNGHFVDDRDGDRAETVSGPEGDSTRMPPVVMEWQFHSSRRGEEDYLHSRKTIISLHYYYFFGKTYERYKGTDPGQLAAIPPDLNRTENFSHEESNPSGNPSTT